MTAVAVSANRLMHSSHQPFPSPSMTNNISARPRATIEDVAKAAGVSTATVSRVMNRSGKVSQRAIKRVEAAMNTLKYVPSATAQGLARHKTNTIGVVLPSFGTPFLQTLLQGISQGAYNHGLSILLYAHHAPTLFQTGVALPIGEHNTDGLLIFSNSADDHLLLYLYERQFPTILLYRHAPTGIPLPSILIDNYQGAYDAVTHLITRCGRRQIAFLRGPMGSDDSAEREAGYRAALETYGGPVDAALIGDGDFSTPKAAATVAAWLASGQGFDAIFAGDDNAAVGAINALQAAGRRVPEEVAVVGFNDDPLEHLAIPPLTTIRAPTVQVGYTAIHHLVQRCQGQSLASVTKLPTELIIRRSCGYQAVPA